MAASYSDQLDSVQAAIAAIEGGSQSISWNGRSRTSADLSTLYEREQWLRRMVDRSSRGGIRVRGATPS